MNHVSPLVLDLDGDGVAADLRHIYDDGTVFFDIDADGFAERVGWVGPNDGQLAMDRNGNGRIDDITELYGDDQMPAFSKLRLHDSNGDGQITSADTDWSKLRVWQDLNQDGISQANELKTLAQHSIASIALNDTSDNRYIKENYISNVSTFTLTNGVTREIADVHYLNDNTNTWALGAQSQVFGSTATINVEAMLLPQSRGYGSLPALHLAMTGDAELKALVKSLDRLSPTDLSQAGPLVDQILLRWAGVHDHDPDWRSTGSGNNIDSRKVDFLEEFGGISWAQRGTAPLVGVNASLGVKLSWQGIHAMMTARLLAQGPLEHVFGEVSYDFSQDKLLITDPLATILNRAATSASALEQSEAQTFWATLGDALVTLRASLGQTVAQINSAVTAKAGFNLFLGTRTLTSADGVLFSFGEDAPTSLIEGVRIGDASANKIIGGSGEQVMFGGAGNDTIEGRSGDDFMRGDDGNDSLYGGDGYDRLEGGTGNDRLDGGNDRDILRGDAGNDYLLGGAGNDNLGGGAGADTLDGGTGTDQADYNDSSAAVTIDLAAGTATGGDATGDVLISVEGVNGSQFNDLITGNSGNNVLNGEGGNDTIYGGGGNDVLFGAIGDDHLYGQDGNDQFQAFEGTEHMDGGAGTDLVTYRHPFLTTGVYASLLAGKGYAGAATGDTYVGIENLEGSDWNDVLIGNNGNNVLTAGLGVNVLRGEGGNDSLISTDGLDHLWGGTGADRFVLARAGADGYNPARSNVKSDVTNGSSERVIGTTERLVIIADFDRASGDLIDLSKQKMTSVVLQASGTDTFIALGDGRAVLVVGKTPAQLGSVDFVLPSGVPTVTVGAAKTYVSQTLRGSDSDNAVRGGMGADTLLGLGGADTLIGESGSDRLDGGAGDDRLIGGRGADALIGGSGFDTADYGESELAVSIDLATGTGSGGAAQGDTLSTIEALRGSKLSDTLRGDAGANTFWGDSGDDAIIAGAGNDKLYGDEGDDHLQGGDGNDELAGGQGADRLDGGAGTDIAEYHRETSAIVIDLTTAANNAGAAKGDVLISIENVTGTFLGDIIRGDAASNAFYGLEGNDRLEGLAGNDQLTGDAGNDSLYGGDGDDILQGGAGADHLDGGAGTDQADYSSATSAITIDLTTASNRAGDAVGDVFVGIERFVGTGFNDLLRGATGADIFSGRNGNDRLEGLAGNDQLHGDAGNDTLYGGDGDDVLLGGAGADHLDGGAGTDQADYGNATSAITVDLTTITNRAGDAVGDVFVSIERFVGSGYNDLLRGATGADIFFGRNGNDRLEGLTGNDQLHGDAGNDSLYGGDGDDLLQGGAGADRLDGGAGSDQADYGNAAAAITVDLAALANNTGDAAGDTYIGIERFVASGYNDILRGSTGADLFFGRNGNDRLEGQAGNDQLYGDAGNDSLYGGDGDDMLQGGAGADRLDGGAGSDQADYSNATTAITVNLAALTSNTGDAAGDTYFSIERYVASGHNDVIRGGSAADIFFGRNGNDRLEGLAGNDQLYGEVGNDSLYGGDGDDMLQGGAGADRLDGGAGSDQADYSNATTAITVNLAALTSNTGDAAGDTYFGIERYVASGYNDILRGSTGADVFFGRNGNDRLEGLAGNDQLIGEAGNDSLYGGDGDDILQGGAGADRLDGGAGSDQADYGSATAAIKIDVADAANRTGDAAGDTYYGIERYAASNYNDTLLGHSGANIFFGRNGNDRLEGLAGDDQLFGDAGNDSLYGGDGNDQVVGGDGSDLLTGGKGSDYLLGGAGNDTFLFYRTGGADVVGDFTNGTDKIRMGTAGTDFSDLDISQYNSGGRKGVLIDYGASGDSILLESDTLKVAHITAADFIFG